MTKHRIAWIAAPALALTLFAATGAAAEDTGKPIPQPVIKDLKVAPDSARLDLTLPKFSNPTEITNPLFPISKQESVLLVGKVDGKPFRTEVTLLPYTRIIEWEGVEIECAVSQYVAFLDGRITEVAIDLYAQADDGSVWYLGEDVSDFKDGVIHTKEGTWHAGIDGPPAMIMPGVPKPGDVYRTENMPGIAFEEVTVKAVDQPLDGPFGKLSGGMIGRELHMDGNSEDKQFAPGYGEFYTSDGGDVEALAMAVPTDRAEGEVPADLTRVTAGALEVFAKADTKEWKAAAADVRDMQDAWSRFSPSDVPRLIEPKVAGSLEALAKAVTKRDAAKARQAAIETARWSLDVALRYRPAVEIDLARLDLWAAQILVDAAAGDEGAVKGDTFAMMYTRDRVIRSLEPGAAQRLNILFGKLQPAASEEELDEAVKIAGDFREVLAGLGPKN